MRRRWQRTLRKAQLFRQKTMVMDLSSPEQGIFQGGSKTTLDTLRKLRTKMCLLDLANEGLSWH